MEGSLARRLPQPHAGSVGWHAAAVLVEAGKWADEAVLRETLNALAPKLAAIGLQICRREAGLRMAKARPMSIPAQ